MERYTPPTRNQSVKFLFLVVCSLVLGAALGIIAYVVGKYYYVIFLSALALSITARYLLNQLFVRFKIHYSKPILVVCGIVGLEIIFFFHYSGYWEFRNNISTVCSEKGISVEDCSQSTDQWLQQETGFKGFLGFLQLSSWTVRKWKADLYLTGAAAFPF